MQHHRPVRYSLGFIQVVSCQHHTAAILHQISDDAANHLATIKVDTCCWFIKKGNLGGGRQCKSE
jgi:hypothetical protein